MRRQWEEWLVCAGAAGEGFEGHTPLEEVMDGVLRAAASGVPTLRSVVKNNAEKCACFRARCGVCCAAGGRPMGWRVKC
jgi:hypothetical protein